MKHFVDGGVADGDSFVCCGVGEGWFGFRVEFDAVWCDFHGDGFGGEVFSSYFYEFELSLVGVFYADLVETEDGVGDEFFDVVDGVFVRGGDFADEDGGASE